MYTNFPLPICIYTYNHLNMKSVFKSGKELLLFIEDSRLGVRERNWIRFSRKSHWESYPHRMITRALAIRFSTIYKSASFGLIMKMSGAGANDSYFRYLCLGQSFWNRYEIDSIARYVIACRARRGTH